MLTTIIATNVQNGIPFHGDKPEDVSSICQSPHRQPSAARQTRPHSNAAAKLFKVVFVYPFVTNSFMDLLAPNLQTHTDFKI